MSSLSADCLVVAFFFLRIRRPPRPPLFPYTPLSRSYRLITESLLGLDRQGERLRIAPCMPVEWPSYTIHYRFRETVYHITVARAAPGEPARCVVDGADQPDGWIPLQDDRHEHHVQVAVV